jgi:lipoate-protein ligase A
MEQWRFLPLEVRNGYWNMAIDEAILKAVIKKKSPNTLRLYKWNPSTASIGRNQSLNDEVDLEFCKREGFNVVRRITGGGAVFHDKTGEITYSLICPLKFLANLNASSVLEQYEIITHGIIKGLNIYGIHPETGKLHCPAIFLDGKKFSGNAQVRRKGFLLQHGTILLDIEPELMYSVLKTPPNVSKSRMVQSVRTKCIGIKKRIEKYNQKQFVNALKNGFENILNIELAEGTISSFEQKEAKKLVEERYKNEKWLSKYD